MPFHEASRASALPEAIAETLAGEGPAICEVLLDPNQQFSPKQASRKLPDGRMESAPLEDLAPFLDRDELAANMFIPLIDGTAGRAKI
jgi:acetolactate synthase-1/2/3 large subunit